MNRQRRRFLRATLASAATALAGPTVAAAAGPVYRWGSSSLGSSGYVIMEAFAQTANRHTPFRNASLATAGTAENMYLIGRGDLEFAHSTSVDWSTALAGRKPYKQAVRANQLFAYALWQQMPIVHADSAIRAYADLGGRTFSPSLPGSGTAAMYNELMQAAGLQDRLRWRYGSWSEVYTAFRARQIDSVVGVLTNGRVSSGIQQLAATSTLRILDIPENVLQSARIRNPGIFEGTIDSPDWAADDGPVRVPVMTGIVACAPAISAQTGYEMTRAILDRAAEVQKLGAPLGSLSIDLAVSNLVAEAPVNAGAARYFREQGVWRNELHEAPDT